MSILILGVDLGKNSCSVVGVDATGAVVTRRSMRRQTLIEYVAKLPACVIAMEACCRAHQSGRQFCTHRHEVRLMSAEYVRPYVKAHKNDDRDAEAIAEAASRLTMRFVELKSEEQLDLQTGVEETLGWSNGEREVIIAQTAVEDRYSRLQHSLRALRRPSHLPAFVHAPVNHGVGGCLRS